MGKSWTRKRWVKAAVLTVGVADCLGIYYASHRLDNTVPDEVRYDRTAYTVPESSNMFHAGNTEMFADADDNGVTHSSPALASASPAAAAPAMAAAAPRPVELAVAPASPLRAPVLVGTSAVKVKPAAPAHLALAAPAPAPAKAAPAPVVKAKPAIQAHLALAAPTKIAPAPVAKAPTAKAAPVARLAAAAPKPVPAKAAHQAEGPHGASVSHMLAALQPAPKVAARPAPAKAAAVPILIPHLATVAHPEKMFHAGPTKLTGAKHTASLALGTDLPAAKVSTVSRKSRSHSATSLARLVPAPRMTSEFAAAFAGMDAPIAAQPLEASLPAVGLATPVLSADSAPVVGDKAVATVRGSVLENVLPAPQPELPPVSASAEDPAAKL